MTQEEILNWIAEDGIEAVIDHLLTRIRTLERKVIEITPEVE